MKILMFSTHSMKYIWYSPQKSKYPLYMVCLSDNKTVRQNPVDIREKNQGDMVIIKVEQDTDGEDTSNTVSDTTNMYTQLKTDTSKDEDDTTLYDVEDTDFPKQCHICKNSFENMKSFSKHVRTHNLKPRGRRKSKRQEVWPCCVCERPLSSAVRQACHHYSKHGIPYDEKLKLYACDVEVFIIELSKNVIPTDTPSVVNESLQYPLDHPFCER